MRGGKKEPLKEEKPTIDFAFSTIVTIKNIHKGEKFTKKNIWVKRPGTGQILAREYNDILGKTSNKTLPTDYHLKYKDIL